MAMWGFCSIVLFLCYRPPPRHGRYDHLSFWGKIRRCDIPGSILVTAGGTFILTGLSLGENPWPWNNARVVSTLVIGAVLLIAFGLYEWKGTSEGIAHHDLFKRGRTYGVLVVLMFIEGIGIFTFVGPTVFQSLFLTYRKCSDCLLPRPHHRHLRSRPRYRGLSSGCPLVRFHHFHHCLWLRFHQIKDHPTDLVVCLCRLHRRSQ